MLLGWRLLVSPILVRPVREQLEHDRIIRLLQAKAKRRYEVGINPGAERNAAVGTGATAFYPDLVLLSQDRGRRLQAIIEVETGESVNHLEALAEWASYARTKAAFHLYVPSGMVEVARRLCDDNQIHASEVWSYHSVGDDVRFTLVHRTREAAAAASRSATVSRPAAPSRPAPATRPAPASRPAPATRSAATSVSRPKARPAARAAAKPRKGVRPASKPARAKAASKKPVRAKRK
jgi:hypothetical protein